MMNRLFILLIGLAIVGCGQDINERNAIRKKNEEVEAYNEKFYAAKKSIRKFMEENLDSNQSVMDGSVSSLFYVNPPVEITNFIGADTSKVNSKFVHYEQQHFCPNTISVGENGLFVIEEYSQLKYYKLDENLKVILIEINKYDKAISKYPL